VTRTREIPTLDVRCQGLTQTAKMRCRGPGGRHVCTTHLFKIVLIQRFVEVHGMFSLARAVGAAEEVEDAHCVGLRGKGAWEGGAT
jgi:hypothetical protein